jgi:hypothetical protein
MKNPSAGPEPFGPARASAARINGFVDFCQPSRSLRLQTAGSCSQAQISSAHRHYRQLAHPRPNFASHGVLPPSQRAEACASWETPSVQGRLSLLDRSPEGAALRRSLTRALILRKTSRLRFSASNAPTRNRARSTGGGYDEVVFHTLLKIVKDLCNPMNFRAFACARFKS